MKFLTYDQWHNHIAELTSCDPEYQGEEGLIQTFDDMIPSEHDVIITEERMELTNGIIVNGGGTLEAGHRVDFIRTKDNDKVEVLPAGWLQSIIIEAKEVRNGTI